MFASILFSDGDHNHFPSTVYAGNGLPSSSQLKAKINKADSKSSLFILKYKKCKSNLFKGFRNSRTERGRYAYGLDFDFSGINFK